MNLRRLTLLIVFGMLGAAPAFCQPNMTVLEQQVRGNSHISIEAVLAATQLKPGTQYTAEKARQDRNNILALGLFSGVLPRAEQGPNGVTVIYEVVENPFVESIEISGNTVVSTKDILNALQTKTQQVFNTNLQRGDSQAIRDLYGKKGYPYIGIARFDTRADNPSVLELQIIEARVAKINIVDNKRTKTRVIRREIRTKEGDVFNRELWDKDIYRVYNLGFFEDIATRGPREYQGDPGLLEMDLLVKEKPTGNLNVGFGYDQRQGLFGLLEVQDPNFQGRGQLVGISYQRTNQGNDSIELNFGDRAIDNARTGINVRLYDRIYYRFANNAFGNTGGDPTADTAYDERHRGAELSLSRPFGEASSGFLTLRTESINTNDVATEETGQEFIQQDGATTSATIGWTNNSRDLDFNPSRGSFARLALEAGQSDITKVGGVFEDLDLLGVHNFAKASLDARFYFSLQGRRTKPDQKKQVLAVRVFYGHVVGTIPFWEQFFMGGAETLRGYSEDRFWGKNSFLTSVEYRIPLQNALSLVAFADFGDAWGGFGTVNEFVQHDQFEGQLGFGAGIHFQTPLGPLRLDFGFNQDGGSRTHFRVGHTF